MNSLIFIALAFCSCCDTELNPNSSVFLILEIKKFYYTRGKFLGKDLRSSLNPC